MYVVLVDFDIKPDHLAAFTAAMTAQARTSLALEPGCHTFDVCRDPADPTKVFLYELYTDAAAFDRHLKSEHFVQFDALVADWVAHKAVRLFERCEGEG